MTNDRVSLSVEALRRGIPAIGSPFGWHHPGPAQKMWFQLIALDITTNNGIFGWWLRDRWSGKGFLKQRRTQLSRQSRERLMPPFAETALRQVEIKV